MTSSRRYQVSAVGGFGNPATRHPATRLDVTAAIGIIAPPRRPLAARPEPAMARPAVELRSALTYATHDGVALQGDLYLPATRGAVPALVPALVAVHGGGWQQGARTSFQYWGAHLAAQGHAVFAISYRFAKKGHKAFPEAVQDVAAAVQFVRGSAGEFGIDPARIGLFGASAGAHLAALAALAGRTPRFAGGYPGDRHADVDTRVKALVGVYGVYDLVAMWEYYRATSPLDNNIENFLGAAPMADRALYFDASPISYATYANNHTAVLLGFGTEDDLVDRKTHSEAFLRALKQAGFFARSCVVQGAGHYWLSDPLNETGSYSGSFAPRLMRFLAEKL
jgi:acetyl esterase/lipase